MKPSTFEISDRIEAIVMFTTFFQYVNPMDDSFIEKAMPAAQACKWIAANPEKVLPSLSMKEVDELIKMVDQVADRMERFKNELLQKFDEPEDNYNDWE